MSKSFFHAAKQNGINLTFSVHDFAPCKINPGIFELWVLVALVVKNFSKEIMGIM